MSTRTIRLDSLPPGQAFRMPALGLTGVVEHVSPTMVRAAIQRRLGGEVEHTGWSCGTEVVAIPAAAGVPVSASLTQASMGAEGVTDGRTGICQSQGVTAPAEPVCGRCGRPIWRDRQPRQYCSPACRTAAYRDRRTA
jgi:hypothetical protein